uniref:COMM domain containing 9 n=1 Tax=Sphenodon punctatus TaxID=8508 RepID=A0A8D0LD12_SPHPU
MAAVAVERFAALQNLLKASSKDVVRQLCQECFSSSASGSNKLIDSTCSSLSVTQEEATQLICALHSLTRHIVYRGLMSAEEILALFPENFHQSLKNLLTKIILENETVWVCLAKDIVLPAYSACGGILCDFKPWMALFQIQEDAALCGNNPMISAMTVELSKDTLDTMLDGLGRIRDQLSAVANK